MPNDQTPRRQPSACWLRSFLTGRVVDPARWRPEQRQQVQPAVVGCRNVFGKEMHHGPEHVLCALPTDLSCRGRHGGSASQVDVNHENHVICGDRFSEAKSSEGIGSQHEGSADEALRRRASSDKHVCAALFRLFEHCLSQRAECTAIRKYVHIMFPSDKNAEQIARFSHFDRDPLA